MTAPNWPGDANKPALGYRAGFSRKSLQLPFATEATPSETDAPEFLWGTGSPQGVVVGTLGDLYTDTAGGGVYYKASGVNTNTGWEVIALGASIASLLGKRVEYFIRINGTNDADNIIITEMTGYTRFGGPLDTATRWRPELSSRTTVVFTDVDDRRSILLKPGNVNDAANTVRAQFQLNPVGGTEGVRQFVDFRETFGGFAGTQPTGGVVRPPSWSIEALMRKESSGDTTHARVGLGFSNISVVHPSKPVPRIGIHGNGVNGFQFGSVNCPDGLASGDNASTDIDANAVAPADISSPGANWFHVRIKVIPPTPTQTGRWGAYLNGALVGTFTLQANFPRGGLATDQNYRKIQPGFWAWPDAVQIPGILLTDMRITIEDDWTL